MVSKPSPFSRSIIRSVAMSTRMLSAPLLVPRPHRRVHRCLPEQCLRRLDDVVIRHRDNASLVVVEFHGMVAGVNDTTTYLLHPTTFPMSMDQYLTSLDTVEGFAIVERPVQAGRRHLERVAPGDRIGGIDLPRHPL